MSTSNQIPVGTAALTNGNRSDSEESINIHAPIKLIKKSSSASQISNATIQPQQQQQNTQHHPTHQQTQQQQRSLQKQISSVDPVTPLYAARNQQNGQLTFSKNITLETIITEYLTNQHALCKNPMSTCPQFDLILPHKCPDPRPTRFSGLSQNFSGRYFRKQAGYDSKRLDRRLIHSNFCVARTIRPEDPDNFFTCCAISPCATSVVVGANGGEVKVYNINETGEEFSYHCHESCVNSIKFSRDGTLISTSCTFRSPLSALWSIENRQFQIKLSWEEEEYMEFANVANDRILGTKSEVATIYDLRTGQKIQSFTPTIFNQYTKNRATFYPTDDLILSGELDCVRFDISEIIIESSVSAFQMVSYGTFGLERNCTNSTNLIKQYRAYFIRTD